ncbi:oligosaccharide flippase family protein [Pseudomonadota bacterium]
MTSADRQTVSNVVTWGVGLGFAHKVSSILLTLILVRLLSPEIYGQYGLVAAVLMFALAFSMQRFMEHSFHSASGSEDSYKYHLGFGILLHVGIFTVFNIACFVLNLPENYDAVRFYLHIGSFSILLNIPRIYYSTHLRRTLDWRRQRILHLISFLLSAVVAIGMALSGFGVLALLAQNLLVPVPYIVDLVWRRPDMLECKLKFSYYKGAFKFGIVRSGSAFVVLGQKLIEASAFTAIVGFSLFGIYGRAIGLGTLGAAWLADQIHNLVYPILAKVPRHSPQARSATGLVLRLAAWSSIPMAIALTLSSDAAVALLYGQKWDEVSPLLPATLALAVITTITTGLRLVLLTNYGPARVLFVDIALIVVCITGLYFALDQSVLFYCWFLVFGGTIVLAIVMLILILEKILAIDELMLVFLPMFISAGIAFIIATNLEMQFYEDHYPVTTLVASILATTALGLTAIRLFDPDGLRRVLAYLPAGPKITHLMRL